MAALAVVAELKFRDGRRQKLSVKVENNLSSLINGVNELNLNVSQLLSELVEREKARGHCAQGEEDEEDEQDSDDEDPPVKRSKT